MEREPPRQQHDLDRHDRNAAPGNGAVEREQVAGEDVAVGSPALGQNPGPRARHVRSIDVVADHLQGEIGL